MGTGSVFSFLFHWGTVEPQARVPETADADNEQGPLGKFDDITWSLSCIYCLYSNLHQFTLFNQSQ